MKKSNDELDPLRWLREFRARLASGEPLSAQQFATEKQLNTTDETFVDLIFAEFLELEVRGNGLAEAVILEKYPTHADEIKQQILLHRMFQFSHHSEAAHPSIEPQSDRKGTQKTTYSENNLPSIPGFEVLRILGRGGMGVVLLAKDLTLERLVAIKLLLGGELASKDQRQRFRTEAQAAASLRHPHIVQVDDVDEVNGQPFIVMEYVEGGTLEDLLRRQAIAYREAAQFIREISWALHAAHQAGIVHRDLKPGNLLLAPRSEMHNESSRLQLDNQHSTIANQDKTCAIKKRLSDYEPKIADFGLAKSLRSLEEGQVALTVKGDVLGTPSYMSPEQARGDTVLPSTDIYSLGSILYEMLAGVPPFQRATPWETVQCVLEQQPPPLPMSIPLDLRTICEKCLRKESEYRYASMAALAVDLGLFLQGRSIRARPVGSLTRLLQWAKRNVVVASLLTLVGLTLCTLLIVSLWSSWTLLEMLENTQLAKRQETLALQISREQLWENLLSEARAIQTSRQVGQRYRSLDKVLDAHKLIPALGATVERRSYLRDTAIAALPLLDVQSVPITDAPLRNQSFISADRKFHRLAFSQSDGSINIIQPLGQNVFMHFPAGQANSVVISPNGRYVIVNHQESILLWLDENKPQRSLGKDIQWPVFSEDSNLIAGYDDLGLFVHRIESEHTTRHPDIPLASMPMSFSPDGSRLAVVCKDRLLIVGTESNDHAIELPGPNHVQMGQSLAWHPGGDYLAAGLYSDREITVWHLPTRYRAKLFRVGGQFHNLQFDRTGQYLLAAGLWGGPREVFDFATQESLLQLPRDTGIAFGADDSNSILVLGGSSLRSLVSWRIENQLVTTFIEPANILTKQRSHCEVSKCGNWLFVNSEHGLEIYDILKKRPVGAVPIGPLDYSGIIPTDDGGFILLQGGGCQKWSIRAGYVSGRKNGQVPPELSLIEVSADGRWGLCSDGGGIYLHDFTEAEPLRFLGPQADVRSASFDLVHGRIATSSWNHESEITIWNLQNARAEQRLSVGNLAVVRFSPDGSYLFSSSNGGSIWDTSSWAEWQLNSADNSGEGFGFAFSHDSRWFAHTSGSGLIKIQDLRRQSTIASLTDPNQHHYFSLSFSLDNTALFGVTIGRDSFVKHWDLKKIDQHLVNLNLSPLELGGDLPLIKPVVDKKSNYRFQILSDTDLAPLAEQQVLTRIRHSFEEQRWASGLAVLREAAMILPDSSILHAELAWRLLSSPIEFQDPATALSAIRVALQTNNDDRNLLVFSFALDKLRQYEQAMSILTNLNLSGHEELLAKYLEARLLAQLGRIEEAQTILMSAHELESRLPAPMDSTFADWDRFRREVDQTVTQSKSLP